MFSINEKKLNRQKEIIGKWINSGYKGIIQAITGFGKTFMAALALNHIFKKRPNASVIIVVPTLYLQQQWQEKLKEFKLDIYDIQVLVINTAAKSNLVCDFLIVDEIHTSAANEFFNLYTNVSYKIFMGLTATLERSDGRHKLLLELFPIVDTVSIEEGLREGYVSDFRVYNLPVDLTPTELESYKKVQKSYSYYEHLLGGRFEAWSNASYYLSEQYKELEQDSNLLKENAKNALMFRTLVNKRKSILYNAENKIHITKAIIELFPDRKGIVFSESQAFAEKLDNLLGNQSVLYHSGLKLKEKRWAIARFLDNRTSANVMVSVKALDAGVDMEGVNYGIAAAGSSKQLQDIQRRGRSTRVNKKNTIAYYFNLYVPDTQEEKWIRTKCYGVPNVMWIESLNEIEM